MSITNLSAHDVKLGQDALDFNLECGLAESITPDEAGHIAYFIRNAVIEELAQSFESSAIEPGDDVARWIRTQAVKAVTSWT